MPPHAGFARGIFDFGSAANLNRINLHNTNAGGLNVTSVDSRASSRAIIPCKEHFSFAVSGVAGG